jgi:hypothetical protein
MYVPAIVPVQPKCWGKQKKLNGLRKNSLANQRARLAIEAVARIFVRCTKSA